MAIDFKQKAKRAPAKKQQQSTGRLRGVLGFVVGLTLGLFIAFLVYLKMAPTEVAPPPPAKSTKTSKPSKPKPTQAQPTKETDTDAVGRPRFEFYTILPGREVMIPDAEMDSPEQTAPPTKVAGQPSQVTPTKAADVAGEYVLQAGSFRQYADADRLKASIAMLGIVASIQSVVIKQEEQWHRVRIGPVDSMTELNRIRTLLANNNIKVLVIRNTSQSR